MGAEGLLSRVDKTDVHKSHGAKLPCEVFDITIEVRPHLIIDGEDTTLPQHSQALEDKRMLIRCCTPTSGSTESTPKFLIDILYIQF